MKLDRCQSVRDVGRWLQQHGLSPGENRYFNGVAPVHSDTSMHYRRGTKDSGVRADKQGDLALDVNDVDVKDTLFWRLRRGRWRCGGRSRSTTPSPIRLQQDPGDVETEGLAAGGVLPRQQGLDH